jgi:hypothetical protein
MDEGSGRRKAAAMQDSRNIEETRRDIHALSGIRNHDPSVWVSERGHCDRHDPI